MPLRIRAETASVHRIKADAAAIFLFEDEKKLTPELTAVDKSTGGLIKRLRRRGGLKGTRGEVTLLHEPGGVASPRLVMVGLGKSDKLTGEVIIKAAGIAARRASSGGVSRLVFGKIPSPSKGKSPRRDIGQDVENLVTGAIIGPYDMGLYKSKKNGHSLREVVLAGLTERQAKAALSAGRRAVKVADSVNFTRKLVFAPGNEVDPAYLAAQARALGRKYGFSVQVHDRKSLEKMGMNAILGVAQGSRNGPRLIVMKNYRGSGRGPIAFVGKGVTFDTGGISIKPSKGMEEMKMDMAGAGAVLGAMRAIGELKIKAPILAVMPCVENMPGGTATRPGDVVKTYSGKTVEIVNTDAEGRLILADALAFAARQGAERIIDLATLTGAVVIALGTLAAGLLSNDEEWCGEVEQAAEAASERLWRLPLYDEYLNQMKSPIADLKNIGNRTAGTSVGGIFLKQFVDNVPWVHLDIAGTAWTESRKAYLDQGATGFGVRTLVKLAEMA